MGQEQFHIYTLPNGIRVIHHPFKGSDVAHCGLIIGAGSRDERPEEQGLVHFIEHALFKGTHKRKAYHILSGLDAVGGELNAYTTKEATTIYASFQNRYFEKAVELIADISFNASFPEKEINKEKEVVVDEINSYLDSPSEQIFDDFEEQIFQGHSIGRNILGTEETVRGFRVKDLIRFRSQHFSTDRMVFSITGNIPLKKVNHVLDKYLVALPANYSKMHRTVYNQYQPQHLVSERTGHQEHCIIGTVAYSANDDKRQGLILLNNILGGPAMNSRLNLEIREKYGFTYNIDSSYTSYSDTGLFAIYYGTDQRHSGRTRQLIMKILKKMRNKLLGERQLSGSKKQLIGQIALGRENRVNVMLSLGKSLLLYNTVDSIELIYQKINDIQASDLLEVANEIFDEKYLSSLTFPGREG